MKKNLIKLVSLASLVFILSVPILSLAQSCGNGDVLLCANGDAAPCPNGATPVCTKSISVQVFNPLGNVKTVNGFIKLLLEGLIKIGMPIVALALIYCGFLFVKARGNAEELKTAKNALLYTVIGAAILIGSWAIAQLISETVLSLSA
jgi:hypothetical protein